MTQDVLDLTREWGELGDLLRLAPEPDDFLEAGLAWLEGIAPYDLATVWEVDGDVLKVRTARGKLKTQKVLQHEVDLKTHDDLRRVLRDRMPRVNTEHDHKDGEGDLFDHVIDLAPGHSCMVVPLYAGTETLGLLSLDRNVCESYSGETMRLVDLYGRILALGLLVASRAQTLSHLYREERSRNEILARDPAADDPVSVMQRSASVAIRAIVEQARAVAVSGSTLLILGETGTGKDVMAQAVHQWSPRREAPFIKVNCAAIPEGVLESELFGHVKGAFTGAVRDRDGRFRVAHGGTLFLDELGELPAALQAKLLRVLQEGCFEPLGSDKTIKVDVRIIAATNVDLAAAVKRKAFREDLYYRLSVFPLHLPPLRERLEDLPVLVEHLLGRFRHIGPKLKVSTEGLQLLRAYSWPGNIRELSNVLERAVIMANARGAHELTPFLALASLSPGALPGDVPAPAAVMTLNEAMRQHIKRALVVAEGKIYGDDGAAAMLGMKPSTLQSKMKKLKIKK